MTRIRTAVLATLVAAGLVAAPFGHADPAERYNANRVPSGLAVDALTLSATALAIGASPSAAVDATAPPAPTIDSAPLPVSGSSGASFGFSDSEPGVAFECQLDNAGFASCTSPATYSSLGDGAHVFQVRARDVVGNTSDPTAFSWTIDTAAPTVTLTAMPPALSNDATPTFGFSASEAGATFECKLDASAFAACTSPTTFPAQIDGPHTFVVRATDAAGNTGPESAPYTWTIDTIAPSVTINSGPDPATSQTTATFAFSSTEAGSTFQCKLNGAAFASCTSPKSYSGLRNGANTFRVRATDPAGNASAVATYAWTVDTVNPVVTITSGPAAATNQTTATFVFSSNKGGSIQCSVDSTAFAACTSPKTYSGVGDGPHTFRVRATDSAGKTGPASPYSWTVDTVAPDTAILSGPPLSGSSGAASFTFASNESGATFACSLDGGAFSPCSSPQAYSGLANGRHTLAVRAFDAVGNVDQTPASYSWTVSVPGVPDTTPPGLVRRLASAVGYGLLRLSWTLPTDPDFDHVSVFVATRKRGPLQKTVYTGKGRTFINKKFRNGSYYRFAVISYDHAGNHSKEADVVVSPSALLRSPRNGASLRKPPRLAWAAVQRATYYNVQLVYAGRKVLSAWPKRSQLQLRRRWTYRRAHRLKKGSYTWYVWPGFGARSAARYGQLLGHGSFVVR